MGTPKKFQPPVMSKSYYFSQIQEKKNYTLSYIILVFTIVY